MIFFFGLVLVLRKVLISSSYAETKRLQQLNEENSRKAQELAGKLADAENEYREKMVQTDEEIRVLKAKAKKEIEELKEAIIAKGKAEGDRIVTQALNARDEIRAEIEEQMHERSVELARKIIAKVLQAEEQRLVHDGLLETVTQELQGIDRDQLRSAGPGGESQVKVQIRTPRALTDQQKEKLEKALSLKLEKKLSLEEVIDEKIMAGIVMTFGSFVIDGSLSGRFAKAAASIK